MKTVRIILWITGLCEALLGVPVIGGLLVLMSGYSFLIYMLIAHIVALIICVKYKRPIYSSVLGIAASALGWIPFLGMTLHIVAAVFLIRNAVITGKLENQNEEQQQIPM
ncbi:hypothetical protein AB4Z21_31125 [Paenibacillus sp. MCAF20]